MINLSQDSSLTDNTTASFAIVHVVTGFLRLHRKVGYNYSKTKDWFFLDLNYKTSQKIFILSCVNVLICVLNWEAGSWLTDVSTSLRMKLRCFILLPASCDADGQKCLLRSGFMVSDKISLCVNSGRAKVWALRTMSRIAEQEVKGHSLPFCTFKSFHSLEPTGKSAAGMPKLLLWNFSLQ